MQQQNAQPPHRTFLTRQLASNKYLIPEDYEAIDECVRVTARYMLFGTAVGAVPAAALFARNQRMFAVKFKHPRAMQALYAILFMAAGAATSLPFSAKQCTIAAAQLPANSHLGVSMRKFMYSNGMLDAPSDEEYHVRLTDSMKNVLRENTLEDPARDYDEDDDPLDDDDSISTSQHASEEAAIDGSTTDSRNDGGGRSKQE